MTGGARPEMPLAPSSLARADTVLEHVVMALADVVDVTEVRVVCPAADRRRVDRILRTAPWRDVVGVREIVGQPTIATAVAAGCADLPAAIDRVVLHRLEFPLASTRLIRRVLAAVTGDRVAGVPGVPVVDTVKLVDPASPDVFDRTIDRSGMRVLQSPWVFDRAALLAALDRMDLPGPADPDQLTVQLIAVAREMSKSGAVHIEPGELAAGPILSDVDAIRAEVLAETRR